MKIRKRLVLLLMAVTLHSWNDLQSMNAALGAGKGMWRHKGKIGTACILAALGTMQDRHNGKRWCCIDVSTPRRPVLVDNHVQDTHLDVSQLSRSITKIQLEHDESLVTPGQCQTYEDLVDTMLQRNFWVSNPDLRKALSGLVMHMSCDEQQQLNQGNISMVHGTNKGASILLRTIFDEVLNDQVHENHLLLRDTKDMQLLQEYGDVHEYYHEQEKRAQKIVQLTSRRAWGECPEQEALMQILSVDKSNDMLCTNFGLFGQSSWLMHGYKESSLEFLASRASWKHQLLTSAMCIAFKPWILLSIAREVVQNPASINDLYQVVDRHAKYANDEDAFEKIFTAYGAQELYPMYQEELEHMRVIAGAGLAHMFIPEQEAKRWCYVSKQCGLIASKDPETVCAMSTKYAQQLPNYQARALIHPELCAAMKSRFYLLGDPDQISAVTQRMYGIAAEVKRYQEEGRG